VTFNTMKKLILEENTVYINNVGKPSIHPVTIEDMTNS
jgi:hypothetical protein